MTPAERLRHRGERHSFSCLCADCEAFAAACLAGAKALDWVASIAAEPNNGGVCDYCGRKHWRDGHEPTCRWQQARDLVQPREDGTR